MQGKNDFSKYIRKQFSNNENSLINRPIKKRSVSEMNNETFFHNVKYNKELIRSKLNSFFHVKNSNSLMKEISPKKNSKSITFNSKSINFQNIKISKEIFKKLLEEKKKNYSLNKSTLHKKNGFSLNFYKKLNDTIENQKKLNETDKSFSILKSFEESNLIEKIKTKLKKKSLEKFIN